MVDLKKTFLTDLKIKRKKFWFSLAISFLILVVLSLTFFLFNKDIGTNKEDRGGLILNEKVPTIDISQIPGINEIYSVASKLEPSSGQGEGKIHAAIFPHHTLIADQLTKYWQELVATTPPPSVIVIIGAAHENQGEALIQTTTNDYQTDFGLVKTSDDIVSVLVSDGAVDKESSSFDNEHSIGTFIPFIAKSFPDVPIVPIIAKSKAGEKEAGALVTALKKELPTNALVIFSLDFSHGLGSDAALTNNETVRSLMRAHDYSKIDVLNETFLDSPFTLEAFLLWSAENNWDNELVWHSHSGEIVGTKNEPGTSYMIFFSPSREEPLTLNIVGDIMLSRAVGTKLKTVSIDEAFSQAASVLKGSDLFFANLESVFSTSTVESTKEIRFKADPARIDVLNYLGLTHVSVINNHIGDYGRAAWEESLGYLNAGGVIPVGGYGNDGAPVFVEVAGKRIVFLAFDTTIWKMDTETLKEIVSPLTNQADIILVSFHWGNEYQHKPTSQQIELAHAAIDAGVDVIIGHHPHVLEEIEKYKDGLILYSLGNFIFDQIGEDENESVAAKITWQGSKKTLELVPMRIEGYFPRPATDEEKALTLERMASWSDVGLDEEIKRGIFNW